MLTGSSIRWAMRLAAPAVASLTAGCAIFAGDPATSLGESQDRSNRRINAQYDPALGPFAQSPQRQSAAHVFHACGQVVHRWLGVELH